MRKFLPIFCAIFALSGENITQNLDKNISLNDSNSSVEHNQTESNESKAAIQKQLLPPPNFTSQLFSLPSDAAIIDEIVVRYTDSNGAQRERIIDINRSVDWRDDFVLSARAKPLLSKILDVSVTSNDPDLKNENNIELPKPHFAPKLDLPLETIKFDDKLQFVIRNANLEIITKDELKSYDTNKTKSAKIELFRDEMRLSEVGFMVNVGGFYDINITRKEGFYRIDISNDGNASLKKSPNGYMIEIQ